MPVIFNPLIRAFKQKDTTPPAAPTSKTLCPSFAITAEASKTESDVARYPSNDCLSLTLPPKKLSNKI